MKHHTDLLPLSRDERELLAHITMFGSDGYPVAKLGRRWIVADAFGVKGPPTVFRTKREAVASFEAWYALARERMAAERQREAEACTCNLVARGPEAVNPCPACAQELGR